MSNIDAERKKELKRAYFERKPRMGVFSIKCDKTGDVFLGICKDYTADLNSHFAKLGFFMHPNKELLELYKVHGSDAFTTEFLEELPYIDAQDNYEEELKTLLSLKLEENKDAKELKK